MEEKKDFPLLQAIIGGLILGKLTGHIKLSWISLALVTIITYLMVLGGALLGITTILYYNSYRSGGAFMENLSIPDKYLRKNNQQTFIEYVLNQPPKSNVQRSSKDKSNKLYFDNGDVYLERDMTYLGKDEERMKQ